MGFLSDNCFSYFGKAGGQRWKTEISRKPLLSTGRVVDQELEIVNEHVNIFPIYNLLPSVVNVLWSM